MGFLLAVLSAVAKSSLDLVRHSSPQHLAVSTWLTASHQKGRKNSAPAENSSSDTEMSGLVCFTHGIEIPYTCCSEAAPIAMRNAACWHLQAHSVAGSTDHLAAAVLTLQTAGSRPARIPSQLLQSFLVTM